ncbi:MAG: hypothetical protein NUV59_03155 [Patescibacteria group bacterium]|nr:hypothetical protein [Patescibacteria group bacterium]
MPRINYEPLDGTPTFGPCALQSGRTVTKDYCRTFSGKPQYNAECEGCPCPFRMCRICGRTEHPKTVAQPPNGSGLCRECASPESVRRGKEDRREKETPVRHPAPLPRFAARRFAAVNVGDQLRGRRLMARYDAFLLRAKREYTIASMSNSLNVSQAFVSLFRKHGGALESMRDIIVRYDMALGAAVAIAPYPPEFRECLAEALQKKKISIWKIGVLYARWSEGLERRPLSSLLRDEKIRLPDKA